MGSVATSLPDLILHVRLHGPMQKVLSPCQEKKIPNTLFYASDSEPKTCRLKVTHSNVWGDTNT